MRISWLPRYNADAASTRIRVFAVHRAMAGLCDSIIGYSDTADVLMVQKAVEPQVFNLAASFRNRVVYDFDDVMDPPVLSRAHEVADLFTTDTEGRKTSVSKRCEIIPDSIDYEPAAPWPSSSGEGAVWFGNYPNFESARWMAEALIRAGVPIKAISDLTDDRVRLPVELVQWNYHNFVAELRKASVAILSHANGDPYKSNNKMTASITFGVPCIVHGSRAYSELARDCRVNWAVVSSPDELLEAFRRLQDPAERRAYLSTSQPLIWERYHARAIARRLLEVLEE